MWPVETCQAHIYFEDIGHPHSADTHPDSQHNVLYRLVSIHASYKGIIILYRSNTGVRIYHTSLIGVTRLERAPSWSQIKRSTNWPTPRYLTFIYVQKNRKKWQKWKNIFIFLQRWQQQDSNLHLPHSCIADDLFLLVYIANIWLITPYVLFLPSLIVQRLFGFIYCQHCRYICVYPSSENK